MAFAVMAIFSLATLCLASCGGNYSYKAQIAELVAQINELNDNNETTSRTTETNSSDSYSSNSTRSTRRSRSGNSRSFIGTYKFTDEYNTTWTININRDETVTIKAEGQDGEYYGSWSDFPFDAPSLDFGFKESPIVAFPSGDENIYYGIVTNEYIYASTTAYKAKNPKLRLPIKKIK